MRNPFRIAAKPEPQEENPVIQVMRTASWKIGDVALSWVPGVPYVEITIERSVTKATARMHVKDVLQLQEALSIAFNESNKLGCSVPLAGETSKGE